jgi:hypothetical protein
LSRWAVGWMFHIYKAALVNYFTNLASFVNSAIVMKQDNFFISCGAFVAIPMTVFNFLTSPVIIEPQLFDLKFWRGVGPTQKNETYSRDFFVSANIIQRVVDF